LIGGSVRDKLLGSMSPDVDCATSAHPEETVQILALLGWHRPYRLGEKFGTIGIVVDDIPVEITTFRSGEQYLQGSRKPVVQFGKTLTEDLERRDFTMNAIAMDPLSGELIDPLGGRSDLEAHLVRAVGEPEFRFLEDPLRLLRAIRFAAALDFTIEERTWSAMKQAAPELQRISRERVRDEYSRILTGRDPVRGLTLLRDSGLLGHSAPLLLELTRMPDHGPQHPLSLWDHVMRVVAAVPNRLIMRWAALLHDVAKPRTRTHEPSGRPRFFGHEEVGAQMAREILRDLRYSKDVIDGVSLLIETHMQLHGYGPDWSDGAVRRLVLRLDHLLPDAIALGRADGAGHSLTGTSEAAPRFELLEAHVAAVEGSGVQRPRSPLSGDDLMARYGRPPGPWIRKVKTALEHEVMEGRLDSDDRTGAWRVADDVMNDR
jgi:poly(A) polymerase